MDLSAHVSCFNPCLFRRVLLLRCTSNTSSTPSTALVSTQSRTTSWRTTQQTSLHVQEQGGPVAAATVALLPHGCLLPPLQRRAATAAATSVQAYPGRCAASAVQRRHPNGGKDQKVRTGRQAVQGVIWWWELAALHCRLCRVSCAVVTHLQRGNSTLALLSCAAHLHHCLLALECVFANTHTCCAQGLWQRASTWEVRCLHGPLFWLASHLCYVKVSSIGVSCRLNVV